MGVLRDMDVTLELIMAMVICSLYAHLYKYNVRRGQKVKRGDLIGYVGSTGRSQAPHLHYEVFKDKKRINPVNFYYGNLSPEEFNTLIEHSFFENQSLD